MNNLKQIQYKKHHYIRWIFLVSMMILALTIIFNHRWIYDWYRGIFYSPTSDMVTIRNKLNLTDAGKFLFNATQPELNEADEFNQNCRKNKSEIAVLGCYTTGNIYIYNIESKELDGIRELTMAHELLHAKWARMSENEKRGFVSSLTKVFDANKELLSSEIESYDISERQEELYVRVGTETKNLPDDLEKHFAEIFKDQDAIVDLYENYISVFRKIKERMEVLTEEMNNLKDEIETKVADYKQQADQLAEDIDDFNRCAGTGGCFNTEREFYNERNRLLARQKAIKVLNDDINTLVSEYNSKVEEYNSDVTESRKLQDIVNSNSIPEI